MSRSLLIITTSVVGTALSLQSLFASCLPSSFQDQIRSARIIFVGTVSRVQPVRLPNTVVTRYRFDRVRYLKGEGPVDSLILVQRGGRYGDLWISASDEASYRDSVRYVVFATTGDAPLAGEYTTVGCGIHPFGIWTDSESARSVVHTNSGAVIIAADTEHLVTMDRAPWRPDEGTWTADERGRLQPPTPPAPRPLPDLVAAADSAYYVRARAHLRMLTDRDEAAATERRIHDLRVIRLFPHQDPGPRVSEEEFLRTLAGIVARASGSAYDSSITH
jgi:hypothetical protein